MYVPYRLSYATVGDWFAESGLVVDRRTVYRSVQWFLLLLREAARVKEAGVYPPVG